MKHPAASAPRLVSVRSVPIELCAFLKFGGLSATGGEAKQAITDRRVRVNGEIETQKRKKLVAGDQVSLEGQTLVVHVG